MDAEQIAGVLGRVELGATWAMVGLIWLVQLAHYPLMAAVGTEAFEDYHRGHLRRVTGAVGPFMLAEAAAATALLIFAPGARPAWAEWGGMALLAVVWVSTAALQIPLHGRLERGRDPRALRRLVRTNWIRTLAWSGRGLLLLLALPPLAV